MNTEAVLLPYQQRWLADRSEVKVCEKSRRVGLSWAEAADSSLMAAAARNAGGDDVWYIGYTKDMAEEFINDCAFWSKHYGHAAQYEGEIVIEDEKKQILAFRIRYDSGFRITALSSRPRNLRGKQGKVVIDEAAFHDDLPGLIKAANALLVWGSRVCIISTHNGVDNYFNELVDNIRAGKTPYSLHRITLDDALSEGLYRRICTVTGRTWSQAAEDEWRQKLIDFYGAFADEELFCIPLRSGGTYLPRILIESRMSDETPIVRYSCNDEFTRRPEDERWRETEAWCTEQLAPLLPLFATDLRSFFGEDFARDIDLTVLALIQEERTLVRRVRAMIELARVPFQQQKQILFWIIDNLPKFTGGALDARGNGQYLAEVTAQRYGFGRIHQVMLSNEWYQTNMPRFKAGLEDAKLVGIPQDSEVLADLRAIKVIDGIPKLPHGSRTDKARGGKRHGDAAVALAMAWFATEQDNVVIDFTEGGRQTSAFDGEGNYSDVGFGVMFSPSGTDSDGF